MKGVRTALFCVVIVSSALVAACGGGTSSPGPFAPAAARAPKERPDLTSFTVKPKTLAFASVGKAHAKDVLVTEKGYTGAFTEKSTCKGVAKTAPLSGKGPSLTVKITPIAFGSCAVVFWDAKKRKAKLSVTVGTAPSPSPSPTPTTAGTPTPTPAPTGTPRPTPLPAAIYVTYTGSGSPNVAVYDEAGNLKSTGTWGGAGGSPTSFIYAPKDLNWFYITANNVGTGGTQSLVEVYSFSGGHLTSFFNPAPETAAGALAYESTGNFWIYVASKNNHTIHAYDLDGNAKTLSPGFPTNIDMTFGGLAFDSNKSRFYVGNVTSGNVESYSEGGSLLASITEPGGCTCTPGAVAFDPGNDRIYVWWSGSGGGMSAYDETGVPVTLSGFSGLISPNAMAVDTHNGFLYITDGTSVKVYDAQGNAQATAGAFAPGFTVTAANGIAINPPQ